MMENSILCNGTQKLHGFFVFTCVPPLFADATRKGGYRGGGGVNDTPLPHRLLFADPQNAGPAPRVKYFCPQRRSGGLGRGGVFPERSARRQPSLQRDTCSAGPMKRNLYCHDSICILVR